MASAHYDSPYGKVDAGLPDRLAAHRRALSTFDPTFRPGLGLFKDLDAMITLLNSREWLDWVRVHGPDPQAGFASELIDALDTVEAVEDAAQHAGGHDLGHNPDPVAAIEALDVRALEGCRMRDVLVEVGALAADDTTTPLDDLLRALLA